MNRRLMIVHLALLLVLGLLAGCEPRTEHVVGAVLPTPAPPNRPVFPPLV